MRSLVDNNLTGEFFGRLNSLFCCSILQFNSEIRSEVLHAIYINFRSYIAIDYVGFSKV